MTKNPNPGFFLFCEEGAEGGGRGCRAGQWEVLAREGEGAIIFICDTLYQPNTHCFKFSSRYSIRLFCYGLHKNSLRNLSEGCTPQKN